MSALQLDLALELPAHVGCAPMPCWKGWRVGDRVRVLDGMITGTIFCLPPKMSPHWRATVNFDQPDEHGHDCCFCTQAEMVRDPSNETSAATGGERSYYDRN